MLQQQQLQNEPPLYQQDQRSLDPNDQSQRKSKPVPLPLQSMSLTKPPAELPAQLLMEFEEDPELLGEGAFAVVRSLRSRRTGETVALKVVEKYPLHIRNMMSQLQREVRIQSSLQHRNILRLLNCIEDDSYVYMVLEYCAGGSLRNLCARQPGCRLPEARASLYFGQILQGVDFMHQHNCVHRDLKPENMLLTAADEVRICDFGWSAEVQTERMLQTTCGTPHYWPPELFEGHPQDAAVDLWALGTLVFELLVGHAPFWGSMEELRQKVLSVDVRYPPNLLSQEAIQLFHGLMQKEPRNRIPARALLSDNPWVRCGLAAVAGHAADATPGGCEAMVQPATNTAPSGGPWDMSRSPRTAKAWAEGANGQLASAPFLNSGSSALAAATSEAASPAPASLPTTPCASAQCRAVGRRAGLPEAPVAPAISLRVPDASRKPSPALPHLVAALPATPMQAAIPPPSGTQTMPALALCSMATAGMVLPQPARFKAEDRAAALGQGPSSAPVPFLTPRGSLGLASRPPVR